MKLFKDLQKDDKIFILQPKSFNVHEATVHTSGLHPHSKNKAVWILKFYLPFKNKVITDEALKIAKEGGVDTLMHCLVNANESSSLLMAKPAPTLICTTREEMEKFLRTATPGDIADYLHLKNEANPNQVKRPWR